MIILKERAVNQFELKSMLTLRFVVSYGVTGVNIKASVVLGLESIHLDSIGMRKITIGL